MKKKKKIEPFECKSKNITNKMKSMYLYCNVYIEKR